MGVSQRQQKLLRQIERQTARLHALTTRVVTRAAEQNAALVVQTLARAEYAAGVGGPSVRAEAVRASRKAAAAEKAYQVACAEQERAHVASVRALKALRASFRRS